MAEEAEKAVFRRLKRVVANKKLLWEVVKQVNAQQRDVTRPHQQRLPAIEKERHQLEAARDRYQRAFERDALDESEFGARLAEIRENLRALSIEEADIRAQLADQPILQTVPYEAVKIILDDFVAQLHCSDAGRQRDLIRSLVSDITFDKVAGIKKISLRLHAGMALELGIEGEPAIVTPVTLTV